MASFADWTHHCKKYSKTQKLQKQSHIMHDTQERHYFFKKENQKEVLLKVLNKLTATNEPLKKDLSSHSCWGIHTFQLYNKN